MDKIDKTKDNVGITNLDDGTKKDLFDKFVDAGGEVLDEKQKRRQLIIDRDKQKQIQGKIDKKKSKSSASGQRKTKKALKSTTSAISGTAVAEESAISQYFTRFFIRLRLRINNITELSGLYFKLKFLERFNNTYKPALIEIQMVYLDIFRKNPKVGNKIIQKLDKANPTAYELIMMISDIYDKMQIDQIVEHYLNFPDVPKKVSELKEAIYIIFRKLYILRPYETMIIHSYENALSIMNKLDEKKGHSASSLKRKTKNSVYNIFTKLYPKLHLLFCYYEGKKFEFIDPRIEIILGIKDADKPGNRKRKLHQNIEEADDGTTGETQEEVLEKKDLPKEIKQGLQLMYTLNPGQMRRDFDKTGLFESVSDNDKVLITFLLFNEFDNEYSFILTTNKIKYNVGFDKTGKFDYRTRLHDLYDQMRKCLESFKNYVEILRNYEKVRREKPTDNAQYMEHTKRLETLNKKKTSIGKNTILIVHDLMGKIAEPLEELINDMDNDQQYIENPQDIIEFETHIEGDKKIHGKKIYNAVQTIYSYVSAFAYRLSPDGDLSGSLEFKEGEHIKKTSDTAPMENKTTATEKEMASDKSILDELDDML